MPASSAARLLPLSRAGLPDWCDHCLDEGEFFASRLWFDTLLAHGLPPGATPLAAVTDDALLPLLRQAGAFGSMGSLTCPYSLDWRPLLAVGAEPYATGLALGRLFRLRPPVRLDTLAPEAPGLARLLEGVTAAGLRLIRFDHVGNWHEALPPGTGWEAYLAARPPALRTTIGRRLKQAQRALRYERIAAPGAALEAGIAAYEAVRAASWKPYEPFPDFDGQLMRATAAAGRLRLGVLRDAAGGQAVAAQYWVLDRAPLAGNFGSYPGSEPESYLGSLHGIHLGRSPGIHPGSHLGSYIGSDPDSRIGSSPGGVRATVLKLAHAEAAKAASPGTALSALMIRELLEEDGVTELDFGRGDDPYKRLWVAGRRQRIGVLLVDPRHPAGLAALLRQAAGQARRRLRGEAAATA